MTRRDYVLIAQAVNHAYINPPSGEFADTYNRGIWGVACNLSRALKIDNPRFDEARFIATCEAPEASA